MDGSTKLTIQMEVGEGNNESTKQRKDPSTFNC